MKPIILKQHEVIHLRDHGSVIAWRVVKDTGLYAIDPDIHGEDVSRRELKAFATQCPYGRTGEDRWVKETFFHEPADYCWEASVSIPSRPEVTVYRADYTGDSRHCGWKSSSIMPRELSRFTVTLDVGLKRIQEVNGDDAVGSGLEKVEVGTRFETYKNYEFKTAHPKHGTVITDIEHRISGFSSPVRCLRSLANHTNPGSWDRNDYFWKITCTLKK